MTASSFEDAPGLPILHSKDLVNWRLIGHALPQLVPAPHFSQPRHGEGVWAPALRHHKGLFYLYYPDPDFGIYLTTATHPAGPWSSPVLVVAGKGLIDPCPLWDDDGQNYLVHAYAGSRAGIKSILAIKRLNAAGTQATSQGVLVYDGHPHDPTVEGPKIYKYQGWYYIFAPAGGVTNGWQIVLRSRHIYGPYERRVVMHQGNTAVNGPHQGAWVTTQTGQHWFIHFQDAGAYGRIVHLQPMQFNNGWPVIGSRPNAQGIGQPVLQYTKPNVGKSWPLQTPPDTDEFNSPALGLQWQWMANPQATFAFCNPAAGVLRLFSQPMPPDAQNLWMAPHLLLQKLPAPAFTATTRLKLTPNTAIPEESAGLALMGLYSAGIAITHRSGKLGLEHWQAPEAAKNTPPQQNWIANLDTGWVYLRLTVQPGAVCSFSYSTNGHHFITVGQPFTAQPGRWKGAKMGIYCTRSGQTNDAGYADFDWFRVEPLQP